MHENNFEKKVQEKMDSFGFDPPEVVWANIDLAIRPEKKRRRPLFWIFLFPGLMLLGIGYYYYSPSGYHQARNTGKISEKADKNYPAGLTDGSNAADVNNFHNGAGDTSATLSPDYLSGQKRFHGFNRALIEVTNANPGLVNSSENQTEIPEDIKNNIIAGTGAAASGIVVSRDHQEKENSNNMGQPAPKDSGLSTKQQPSAIANKMLSDSPVLKETVKKIQDSKKKSPWSWGLTASAGVSEINQSLFSSSNSYGSNYSNYPAAGGSPGGSYFYTPSNVTAGFSYSIGALVKRSLSERIYLSAGISYHYYSTGIQTGGLVDTALYLYTSNAPATRVSQYYRNGKNTSYTNQYHYIEIPVSAGFQLNKNRKKPVIWEGGLTLAFLAGSNALQFNSASGVYYHDNQLLYKTQLSGMTSLLFGWQIKGSNLQLGPQLQYGLTQLTNEGAGNPQHLLFFGLKIYYLPGKL